eukprot:3308328-Prymnesium_polylepis.1
MRDVTRPGPERQETLLGRAYTKRVRLYPASTETKGATLYTLGSLMPNGTIVTTGPSYPACAGTGTGTGTGTGNGTGNGGGDGGGGTFMDVRLQSLQQHTEAVG